MTASEILRSLLFLLLATTLEVSGDSLVRKALLEYAGGTRGILMAVGAALLLGYGTLVNLAPVPFDRVVGLYIATLFLVWQAISFLAFRTFPGLPILVGGSLIIAGGLIVSFWQPAA